MSDDFTIDFSGKKKHRCALVIDFDHTLYDGVSFLAKIAKDISDERGVSYNIPFFAKKFLRARFSSALSNIVKNDSTEKTEDLVEDIFAQFDKALKSAEPNPVVLEICKTTLENEGQAVFISSRPQELLEEKIEAFGLEGAEIYRLERQERFAEFPRDSWARAARQLKLNPRGCTSLVATGKAAKNSLFHGMHTIAFPSEFTSYQDYSGSDYVVEPGMKDDNIAKHILELMASRLD